MTVKSQVSGPRYTAESIASNVSRFAGARRATSLLFALALFVTAPLTVRPAAAAVPIYGSGLGYAPDANSAYQIAYAEAEATLGRVCPGQVTAEYVINWQNVWNGFQFVANVRLGAACV